MPEASAGAAHSFSAQLGLTGPLGAHSNTQGCRNPGFQDSGTTHTHPPQVFLCVYKRKLYAVCKLPTFLKCQNAFLCIPTKPPGVPTPTQEVDEPSQPWPKPTTC